MNPNSLLAAASFTPHSLQSPNAWVGHLPFAAWLIKEVRPKIFVELGTHSGNSYFSFCQSVVESGIPSKCFAVDTWQGDEHAGRYNEDIFNKVNAYHQERYAEFSRLLRTTFDDAVTYFSDESIELLHIDGLHTYEAVRHDFDTWLPKLAAGAVVMFHDVNVRERNFGVWKLWEELQARYPNNVEFVHSHGLGVLQLNNAPDDKKLEWLYPNSPEKQNLVNYFAALGSRQLERFELNELRGQVVALTQAVAERDSQIVSFDEALADRDEKISSLDQALAERDSQIFSLDQALADRDNQIASLTEGMVRRGEWALRLESELKNAQSSLATVTQSNSWKLTLPLREARRWVNSPTRQFRRYLRAILKFAKGIYQALPLSPQTKAKHRNALAKYLPRVLLATGAHPATVPVFALPTPTLTEARLEEIHLVVSEKPVVSVIIPVYGKLAYTLRCLRSISLNPPSTDFEIVIIDDCSPDNSAEVLKTVPGIRLLQNAQNLGFIRSCNAGANASLGEYLLFLNNDTEVQANWMEELLRTFYEFPGTGLAGSKLVYPDGRLQEAGGIIWQDGSAWNFGRLQDSNMPVYNYARQVDYCSGASIMVPKTLFDELGGFDEHYLPAYCEDADLALKIQAKGYRVIYQPLSMVIHHEGITSGTDTSQGTKSFQVQNTKKLHERWKDRLRTHEVPGIDVDAAKDRRASRRVLVIDHCTPTPNHDSGSIDAYNLMLFLREMDFQVTFIPEDNYIYMPNYTAAMQRVGVEMLYAPYVTNVEQHLKDSGNRYDLVFLFRPVVAERHMTAVRKLCPKAKVIFHTVDLHFLRMMREAELHSIESKKKAAESMRQRELSLISAADVSTVLSTQELLELTQYVPIDKVRLLPYSRNTMGTTKGHSDRSDVVFVGGFQHPPNVDAVQYFASEVMPLLRKKVPGVRFYVVGSKPPADIQALSSEDIILMGFVEQLEPLLDKMRVSVAPLRYGAGIKGKIGTAMAVGLPVVATSLAAEGMSLTDGENILVADGREAFVDAITRIYQDETLWSHISQNGLTFADRAWGAEAAWRILAGILRELGFDIAGEPREQLRLYPSNYRDSSIKNKKSQESPDGVDEAYQKKLQQELAIYEKQVNVHDLPDIYHYWSNKYVAKMFAEAGFRSVVEFFSLNLLATAARTGSASANFVSVGSGNCDLEVAVAKSLVDAGCNNFILECLEINTAMLERGKENAEANDVLGNMRFVQADFNTWVAGKKYDAVMANQSLHHVTRLEHLFDQILDALYDDGSFVISDMIGRNGHQRWPEALEIIDKFWKELPESYKFNVLLKRFEEEYDNWDCSKEGFEGIRAQDVLPLLLQRFQCEKFVGFGNAIDVFVDRCFGHHFNPQSEWDRNFIDRVHSEDESGLLAGRLTPTHMMAVFVKTLHCPPYYSRGIDPARSIRKP